MKKNKTQKNNQKKEAIENKFKDYEKELNESFDWDFIFDREWSRTKK
jgi:hypothetical protein